MGSYKFLYLDKDISTSPTIPTTQTTKHHSFTKTHKKLIFVRRITTDNNASIQLDPFCFSLKHYPTGTNFMRRNSVGNLYPFSTSTHPQNPTFVCRSHDLYHHLLGHPVTNILNSLGFQNFFSCNKTNLLILLVFMDNKPNLHFMNPSCLPYPLLLLYIVIYGHLQV